MLHCLSWVNKRNAALLVTFLGLLSNILNLFTITALTIFLPLHPTISLLLLTYSALSGWNYYNGFYSAIKKSHTMLYTFAMRHMIETGVIFSLNLAFLHYYYSISPSLCQTTSDSNISLLNSCVCELSTYMDMSLLSLATGSYVFIRFLCQYIATQYSIQLKQSQENDLFSDDILVIRCLPMVTDDEKVIYVAGHEYVPYNDKK
ncbi:hypothetical protein BDF14DRAFT_1816870 [Spinellus fusiger]|nr:hypothetical protein BDF14DRAFT_1816870 [Spinellus fusiger]